MADARIEVEIAAKLENFGKDLNVAVGNVKDFDRKVSGASNSVSQSLARNAAASNQAGFALLNLGRVAQDLPYGFMGIQNNLNPLLESFQALRKEAGSNSAALKLLGSSLMGGAGIGVALSVVTAAISFATMGLSWWTRGAKTAKTASEDYIDTLNSLD